MLRFSGGWKCYRFSSLCCFVLLFVVHFWAANGGHASFSTTDPDWISVTASEELVPYDPETVVLQRAGLARTVAISLPRRQDDMLSLEVDAQ